MDGGHTALVRAGRSPLAPGRTVRDETCELVTRLRAGDAADGLHRRAPHFSARSGMSPAQTSLITVLLAALIFELPAEHGVEFSMAAGFCMFGFLALISLRIAASALPPRWAPRRHLADRALPQASMILALYRESAILPILVSALEAIDYPADRLEILLALEADDHETIAAARALALDGKYKLILVPDGGPRTKPRALNYALRYCRGEIITIHDAEDRPHPRQLRTAAESFAAAGPDLACLQAPLNWFNRSECWLTRQFALEYAAHFHAMLPLYARLGWPLPLGGTSNHFRASALRRAGGWDAWNVTEDADLGFRLHALGYRCDIIAPITLEEAPTRLWAWTCQRTRWIKGYAQTLAVHTRTAPDQPHRHGTGLALAATLGAALASAALHAPLVLLCLYGLATGDISPIARWAFAAFLLAGYGSAALTAAIGMHRAGLKTSMADLLTMPLYWPLQTFAAGRALYQLVTRPYFWDKTEHGISAIAEQACISHSPPHSSGSGSASRSSCSPAGGQDNRSGQSAGPA